MGAWDGLRYFLWHSLSLPYNYFENFVRISGQLFGNVALDVSGKITFSKLIMNILREAYYVEAFLGFTATAK